MSVVVWLQEDGTVALECSTCKNKIQLGKNGIYSETMVCTTCRREVQNPVGVTPVHIEVVADDWEDVGLGAWEELEEEEVAAGEETLAATSDASSA
ncbi:MAG: hypothetical protein CL454_00875 [Acidimicrobiaceae bacterium]|nr:hypothetical protein [Acidimicrobiaceae bacterium]